MLGLGIKRKLKIFVKVNWIKTLYFNFKMFPFNIAKKLPVFFYGSVKFSNLSGEVIIDAPVRLGMFGFGQQFEVFTRSKKTSEINLSGILKIKGNVHIGKDCFLYIAKEAYCEFGHMTCLGYNVKILCTDKIILGKWARVAYESQISDSNFHDTYNTLTKERYSKSGSIVIGNYNWVANRSTIMKSTVTPDYCIIASNSLLSKDYSKLGNYILIGGVPAKLIKEHVSRDWEGEKATLEKNLIIRI
ncbi:acyltransferase [Seonamhaeicola aphaedonensis]|uniref:Acetyltransferase-like isoleucine patch superfamily enzyme n=1 Tax=Seonamhaeicola aphaedonensis TaxID=1461338 RepID=A0A3D9HG99_9FLAO|nr:transferase [Seonamhaeicola aphaedonensis]RED48455.1 acetyltransferase-like isoleucine patch superfamily enzyme [Seonamhaeicola aphaedonensis]